MQIKSLNSYFDIRSQIDVDFVVQNIIDNCDVGADQAAVVNFLYEEPNIFSEDILEEMSEEEIFESKECQEWLRGHFEDLIDEQINTYTYDIINDDEILTIYRSMMFDEMEKWGFLGGYLGHLEKQGLHLGVCWSYDFDRAEAHWGHGGSEYVLESEVDVRYIDWSTTLIMNLHPTLGYEEAEVRLYKGTPLKITGIWKNGESIDVPEPIQRKQFYSSDSNFYESDRIKKNIGFLNENI